MIGKKTIIVLAIISVIITVCCIGFDSKKYTNLNNRVSKAERTLIMLHICFPNQHYKADAAPTCPAFKDQILNELNQEGN